MLGRALLGKWKLWAIGALVACLGTAAWLWRGEIETRVRYAVQGEQMEQALHDTQQRLTEARLERERLDALASERNSELEVLRARERERSRTLQDLLGEDDEAREWADGSLPGSVAERLRAVQQGTQDDNGDRD